VRGAGGHDVPGACPVAEPVLASSDPVDLEPANHCSPSRGPFLSTFWRPRGYASRAWTTASRFRQRLPVLVQLPNAVPEEWLRTFRSWYPVPQAGVSAGPAVFSPQVSGLSSRSPVG